MGLNPGLRDRFNATVICELFIWKKEEGGNVVIKNIGFERMFENWKVERLEGADLLFLVRKRRKYVCAFYLGIS